nr:spermatid nuclear transition protein 1 [Manis javanica]
MAKALNTPHSGPLGLAKPLLLAEITMSTSRKAKSHGMRRGKSRAPHKGVKRGGNKRKYQKGSLKNRKRDDGE